MNKRNDSKIIGEVGEIFVAYLIVKTRSWLARLQQMDYGVDIEVELAEPAPNGNLMKVQVKSTDSLTIKEKLIHYREDKEYIKKFLDYDLPVIFVVADTKNEKAYYVYLQEWVERNREELYDSKHSTIVIKIPLIKELHWGLNGQLKTVAQQGTWVRHTQLINKLIQSSTKFKDNEMEEFLINKMANEGQEFARQFIQIDDILTKGEELGQNLRGTPEGETLQDTLYTVCREFGDYFTLDDVMRMVLREGNSFSMAGLTALSILYDTYPVHMRNLNLPQTLMEKYDMELYFHLYYYCKLREKYIDKKDMDFSDKRDELEMEIDGYMLDDFFYEEFWSYYPNRGTIFFIHCVRPVNVPKDG
ncbi:DUF4365 domain-containing protein [Jeotgalibacillus sp. S-D1]|uniref:DUF4365 domain-containing protein n=1 Tax=Jeotgalibacillus sp. S-D1 TaxID=2552189 RepID=UPI0014047391|nr:DUF4365 domain-containing protein [Jeotgalibacillus sp. S-D1]